MRCHLAVGLGLLISTAAHAQTRPDLSGVWTNTTLTPIERVRSQPSLVVSAEEAQRIARANPLVRRSQEDARPSDLTKDILADGNTVNGYNAGWMDWGSQLSRVKGEYRTSWVVEPADGRIPLTQAAQGADRRSAARQRDTRGPEAMAPNDRCLIASRGSGGPGMLNNLYNNTYQIVQTRDHLVIVVEMVHDARIVPIHASKAAAQAAHRPAAIPMWLGDSVGWWEGDTLLVESVNIHPEQGGYGPIYLSPQGRVTERFQRVSPTEIFYAFEVEDPAYYTRPWRAETTLRANAGALYEYACHEGNYAMEGMLSGARGEERSAAQGRP
jgi:hypothetical protein